MSMAQIVNSQQKLKQVNSHPTRKGKILDVLVTNMFQWYNCPIICPPFPADDQSKGKPSDHHFPVCYPNTNPFEKPKRNYKVITSRQILV